MRDVRWLLLVMACMACTSRHRTEMGDAWLELRSPHFTVLSNAGETAGSEVAAQLERLEAAFEVGFPNLRATSGKPSLVFALKDEDSLWLLNPSLPTHRTARHLAGWFRATPDRDYVIVRTDRHSGETPHVVAHEFAHAFFHRNLLGLPMWADEGLAEFYGGIRFNGPQVEFGVPEAEELSWLRGVTLMPTRALIGQGYAARDDMTQEHSWLFYGQAWATVHLLLVSPAVRDQDLFTRFLDRLPTAPSPEAAAQETLGDLGDFDTRLARYIQAPNFSVKRMPFEMDEKRLRCVVRRVSPAAVLAARAEYMLRSGHAEAALALLDTAQRMEPGLRAVHNGLAYHHLQHGELGSAQHELNAVLKGSPRNATALLLQAQVLEARSPAEHGVTDRLRAALEKLVRLEPDFALPHALLALAYLRTPVNTAKAMQAALEARHLEPGNMDHVVLVGRVLLQEGRLVEALALAEQAGRMALRPHERKVTAAFLEEVHAALPTPAFP